MQGFAKIYVGRLFSGYLKWEVLGTWMTFKKAEMAKTLENGLSMIETNPLNHNWSHFMILSGLTLHQFQKKLLLSHKCAKVISQVLLKYCTFLFLGRLGHQGSNENFCNFPKLSHFDGAFSILIRTKQIGN